MNDFKNIKTTSEAPAAPAEVTATAPAAAPAKKIGGVRAAFGCILTVCAFAAFLFLAYCYAGAIEAILTPPAEGEINLDALGHVLLWILSLIGLGSELVLGIPAALLLRPAKKPSRLRFVRYAAVAMLILSVLAGVAYTVYIFTL